MENVPPIFVLIAERTVLTRVGEQIVDRGRMGLELHACLMVLHTLEPVHL
jgi:hypothetical protein